MTNLAPARERFWLLLFVARGGRYGARFRHFLQAVMTNRIKAALGRGDDQIIVPPLLRSAAQ
jgi:hypothetical protein